MNKIFLLFATAILLSACVTTSKPVKGVVENSPCRVDEKDLQPKGYTNAKVSYRADSKFEISMKLKWDVGENTEFRIELKPKRGSEDAVVTTIGDSATPPGPDITWMNRKVTAKSLPDKLLILCVPAGVDIGTVFKFDINVAGIGTIDPRVAVTW